MAEGSSLSSGEAILIMLVFGLVSMLFLIALCVGDGAAPICLQIQLIHHLLYWIPLT